MTDLQRLATIARLKLLGEVPIIKDGHGNYLIALSIKADSHIDVNGKATIAVKPKEGYHELLIVIDVNGGCLGWELAGNWHSLDQKQLDDLEGIDNILGLLVEEIYRVKADIS